MRKDGEGGSWGGSVEMEGMGYSERFKKVSLKGIMIFSGDRERVLKRKMGYQKHGTVNYVTCVIEGTAILLR